MLIIYNRKKPVRAASPSSANATPVKAPVSSLGSGVNNNSHDEKYARLMDVSLKAGKKFNAMILEKGEEMLAVAQGLKHDVESAMGKMKTSQTSKSGLRRRGGYGISSSDEQPNQHNDDDEHEHEHEHGENHEDELLMPPMDPKVLLRKVVAGLSQLESALYTLQYQSVQTEVDFIKDVKFPPNLELLSLEKEAKEAAKAKLKVKTGGGASRLYSSAQIVKLEEWYGKSSRPESSEIQAMYRIINSPQVGLYIYIYIYIYIRQSRQIRSQRCRHEYIYIYIYNK